MSDTPKGTVERRSTTFHGRGGRGSVEHSELGVHVQSATGRGQPTGGAGGVIKNITLTQYVCIVPVRTCLKEDLKAAFIVAILAS